MSRPVLTKKLLKTKTIKIRLRHCLTHHRHCAKMRSVKDVQLVKNSTHGGINSNILLMISYCVQMCITVARTGLLVKKLRKGTSQHVLTSKENAKPDTQDHSLSRLRLIPKLVHSI